MLLDSLPAVHRLGAVEIVRRTVPKVKREELENPQIYVTYSGWQTSRQTRAFLNFDVTVDVALVAPLNKEDDEADEESEFYLDQLEQLSDELMIPTENLDGWRVTSIECLTPTDPDRWRTQRMYAGILRLSVERQ